MVQYVGKEVRLEKNETVRSLAKKADISPGTISKWETGKAVPELTILELVANVLNVNPWDLVRFVE